MKKQKNFLLDESTINYLQKYKDENHSPNMTAALIQIIDEHKHRNDVSATKVLAQSLAKQVAEELKDPLTRIRLGSNNADRNSEVILLLLNTLLSYSGYKSLMEKDVPQLTQAKQIIKDRISNYRQHKIDKGKSETNPQIFSDEDISL